MNKVNQIELNTFLNKMHVFDKLAKESSICLLVAQIVRIRIECKYIEDIIQNMHDDGGANEWIRSRYSFMTCDFYFFWTASISEN